MLPDGEAAPDEDNPSEATPDDPPALPVHLRRTDENVAEIAALAELVGGVCGLDAVLDNLTSQARPSWLGRLLGRAVSTAYTWERHDNRDPRWWPQGISTSADSSDDEDIQGRRVLVTTWYAKAGETDDGYGSRVTFLDLDTLRYRHVLLVTPSLDDTGALRLEPLRIHAGGIVWAGPYLHVAATSRGFVTCRVDDIMAVADDDGRPDEFGILGGRVASYGHRYVLPVRFRYQAVTEEGFTGLRYSFLSLDRRSYPPALIAGEYARGSQPTRLARYPLDAETGLLATDDDGWSRPVSLDDHGVVQMQGAVVARGRYHATVSQSGWLPGSVYAGMPGAFRRYRFATPPGPEDLAWWPSTDLLWSVTEHPRRRWIYAMPRAWFD